MKPDDLIQEVERRNRELDHGLQAVRDYKASRMKPGDLIRVAERYQKEITHCVGIFIEFDEGYPGVCQAWYTIFANGQFLKFGDAYCSFDVLSSAQ